MTQAMSTVGVGEGDLRLSLDTPHSPHCCITEIGQLPPPRQAPSETAVWWPGVLAFSLHVQSVGWDPLASSGPFKMHISGVGGEAKGKGPDPCLWLLEVHR